MIVKDNMNIQQFLEEEAKKHLAHVGGDERTIPALVMLLKDVSNKVLDEVKREVEKKKVDIVGKRIWIKEDGLSKSAIKRGTWKSKNYNKAIDDISTLINQLKLK